MSSDAKRAGNARYLAKLEQITLRVPKGTKEFYKSAAEQAGKSLNQYIIDLIEQDIASR